MSVWLREVIGWLLLGAGLGTFALSGHSILVQRWLTSGILLAGIGFFVFRGGLHLLKVAMAARAALDAGKSVDAPKPLRSISMGGSKTPPGRPKNSVVPGRTAERS
jgi:hypothetical protein